MGTIEMQSMIGQTLKHKLQPVEEKFENQFCNFIKSSTCAIIGDLRQMSLWIERNRLITRVSTSHVAFPTVDAQILEYEIKLLKVISIC